jgi:hypothetical protein
MRQATSINKAEATGNTETKATNTTQNENSKTKNQDGEIQNKAFGETEDQRAVVRMLDFVQETDINLIVGKWVLARSKVVPLPTRTRLHTKLLWTKNCYR